jgi:hypothetical protein
MEHIEWIADLYDEDETALGVGQEVLYIIIL